MRRDILRVMQDALHEHRVASYPVKNPMLAMNLATHILAKIGPSLTGVRMAAQQFQCFG